MNSIIRYFIIAFSLVSAVYAEETKEEQEALKQALPWIFSGERAFQYETVSIAEIHAYCAKQQGEMSIWYEEYKKRFGEIKDREVPEANKRPENGLMSGVALLTQLNVTFYINKRASDGWRVVGASHDFFVFERQGEEKDKSE